MMIQDDANEDSLIIYIIYVIIIRVGEWGRSADEKKIDYLKV